MKAMCFPACHHDGFVVTRVLGHMNCTCPQVHESPKSLCL